MKEHLSLGKLLMSVRSWAPLTGRGNVWLRHGTGKKPSRVAPHGSSRQSFPRTTGNCGLGRLEVGCNVTTQLLPLQENPCCQNEGPVTHTHNYWHWWMDTPGISNDISERWKEKPVTYSSDENEMECVSPRGRKVRNIPKFQRKKWYLQGGRGRIL